MSERPETDWISVHVFYHDQLDPLLTRVVGPLTEELRRRELADEYFFLRYWDGGGHLRFRVLPTDSSAHDGPVRDLVEHRFRRFLAEYPASGTIDADSYARSASAISRWERVPGFSPLRPNNSLEFIPYRRERERYGYGAAVRAVERHFTESSRLALELLRAAPDSGQRFTAAYSMLVLAWLSYLDDPAWDTSWADVAARPGSDPASSSGFGGLDPAEFEQRWSGQRDTLCDLTRRLRALAMRSGGSGNLADWLASVAELKRVLTLEATAGRFTPPARGWDGAGAAPRGSALSVLPVVDICAHLFCNRIGLSLTEESYVRLLAMRAIRETEEEGNAHAVAGDSRLLP